MPRRKLFSIRKPRLTVSSRGVRVQGPAVRIGGRSGVNISKKGMSYSLRTRAGTYNSRRGCSRPLFLLLLVLALILARQGLPAGGAEIVEQWVGGQGIRG